MTFNDLPAVQRIRFFRTIEFPIIGKRLERIFRLHDTRMSRGVDLQISQDTSLLVSQLLKKSHQHPLEVETALPWDMGVNRELLPKRLDQLWLYGTPFFEVLSTEERLETAWLETARDISLLIQLKRTVPSLFVGYLNKFSNSLPSSVHDYLLVHALEEITQTLIFRRFAKIANLPCFQRLPAYTQTSALFPEMHPCVGLLGTLLISWMVDSGAMHATQASGIDPLTREVFKQHHTVKIRHIEFSRRVIEDYLGNASIRERHKFRDIFKHVIPEIMAAFRFDPEIAQHTSFQFPVSGSHAVSIEAVRTSVHNQFLDEERFRVMMNWLWKMELI